MILAKRASGLAVVVLFLGTAVHSVTISGHSDQGCDDADREQICANQAERICCEFGPTRLTATQSVKFRDLSQGDIATWFHADDLGPRHIYCGGIRKSQVIMGNVPGVLCMEIDNDVLAESNDGANW